MTQTNHPTMLADLLESQLNRPATTRERFRLPFSKDDTVRVLLAGVKAEVERRDKTFIKSEALLTLTEQITEWLTSNHSKFGMMLCDGCGNGRSVIRKKTAKPKNDSDRNAKPKENATFLTYMNGVPSLPATTIHSSKR